MTFREIENVLRADGWVLIRVCGSYYQFRKIGNPYAISVPNHNGHDLSIDILNDLEKQTGLSFRR